MTIPSNALKYLSYYDGTRKITYAHYLDAITIDKIHNVFDNMMVILLAQSFKGKILD